MKIAAQSTKPQLAASRISNEARFVTSQKEMDLKHKRSNENTRHPLLSPYGKNTKPKDETKGHIQSASVDKGHMQVTSFTECSCHLCKGDIQFKPNPTWAVIVSNALEAMVEMNSRPFFQLKSEIIPFIDEHWQRLGNRRRSANWADSIAMTLSKYPQYFLNAKQKVGTPGYWGLQNSTILNGNEGALLVESEPRDRALQLDTLARAAHEMMEAQLEVTDAHVQLLVSLSVPRSPALVQRRSKRSKSTHLKESS